MFTGLRRRCDSRTISGLPPFSFRKMFMSSGGRPTRSDHEASPSTVCVFSGSPAMLSSALGGAEGVCSAATNRMRRSSRLELGLMEPSVPAPARRRCSHSAHRGGQSSVD